MRALARRGEWTRSIDAAYGAASQAAALRQHGQPCTRPATHRLTRTQARRLQAEAACAASSICRGVPRHCANAIHGRARCFHSPPSPCGPAPTRPNVLRRAARMKAARGVRFATEAFACSTLTIRTTHRTVSREIRKTRAMPPSERRRTTEVPAAPAVLTTIRKRPTPARRRRFRPRTHPRVRRRPRRKGMHPHRARLPTPMRRAQLLHLQARPIRRPACRRLQGIRAQRAARASPPARRARASRARIHPRTRRTRPTRACRVARPAARTRAATCRPRPPIRRGLLQARAPQG